MVAGRSQEQRRCYLEEKVENPGRMVCMKARGHVGNMGPGLLGSQGKALKCQVGTCHLVSLGQKQKLWNEGNSWSG